jgi:hypothetical protein
MTKTHKYKIKPTVKNLTRMVLSNPDEMEGSGLSGRPAADVNQREPLEEMAIVKRL